MISMVHGAGCLAFLPQLCSALSFLASLQAGELRAGMLRQYPLVGEVTQESR